MIFTHNIADFCRIHADFAKTGREHHGIIVAKQLPLGILIKTLLKLLAQLREPDLHNAVVWLSDWIS